jgi:hypothetical protein
MPLVTIAALGAVSIIVSGSATERTASIFSIALVCRADALRIR